MGAFNYLQWKDEATGEVYKLRLNEDDSFNEEDLSSFGKAVENFLIKLRRYNKKAHILWAYGMLGIKMMPAIYRAVDAYSMKTGDMKVSVFQLPNTTGEAVGARNHPGILAHERAAAELSGHIKEILAR